MSNYFASLSTYGWDRDYGKLRLRFDPDKNCWRAGSRTRLIKCRGCGQHAIEMFRYHECNACRDQQRADWYTTEYRTLQKRAHALTTKAIYCGALPALDGTILCADCSKPAKCYDHRDYSKPLEVEPVCRSCNHKRGPAIPSRRHLAKGVTLLVAPNGSLTAPASIQQLIEELKK